MRIFDQLGTVGKVLLEANKIEQYKQILEVQPKLLELQNANKELREQNQELKQKLKIKEKFIL